jgi:hypothetical protein
MKAGMNGHSVRIVLHIHADNSVPAPRISVLSSFPGNLAAINQAFSWHVQKGCPVFAATGKM